MFRPNRWAAAGLGLLALGCGNERREAPVTVAGAADTITLPYVDVTSAAWAGGDRWAVVSQEDARADVADFATGESRPLGGPGSEAYRNPSAVFALGDSIYLADWGMRRVTVWGPEGGPARVIPAPAVFGGALPLAVDAAGQLYTERYPSPGRDGAGNRDSAAVLRAPADLGRADTVARLSPLDLAEVESDQGRRFERRALSGQDRWGVLPDGWLWVARVYKNRVDWRSPAGEWAEGDPLPDPVYEVTAADRERFVSRFPPELRATAELIPFAIVKPPFEAGFGGPERTVWLAKSSAITDTVRSIHVVGPDGALVREVRFPSWGRLVAVGPRAILVSEQYAEGVRLLRLPLPEAEPQTATAPSSSE